MTTLKKKHDKEIIKRETTNNNTQQQQAFSFLQYTFGQRLKTSLPPFSKLFFTGNIKNNMEQKQHKIPNDPFQVIHDPELCMFLIKLDSKGTTAAICYLPTTIKNVIETYHIEIPMAYRHKGLGDKLVKECLEWAKESGTLIIPTCAFVQRHLEWSQREEGAQKYGPVLFDGFSATTLPKNHQNTKTTTTKKV
ncbi:hypothetical protein BD770DRAFT_388808, partial [Pilaira anomala]